MHTSALKKLAVLLLILGCLVPVLAQQQEKVPREAQWKKVEDAVKKGLPKTAIEELEPIIAGALQDKDYPEALKAITRKIVLEGNIQGNKPEEKITRLEAATADAPEEMRPMMQAIQAHWYWHYFQQNRWRFLQRTQTSEPPGEDFTTWPLPQLFAEIDKHFTAALSEPEQLQAIPISQYKEFLEAGTVDDSHRPTLYDFLVYQALEFYSSGEQAAALPQDAFILSATSPIFSAADEFLEWQVQTTDATSPLVKAIRLYQQLLKFHADDEQKDAFLDANLSRLNFGHQHAVGEEKDGRYIAALKRFDEKWKEHPISARALYHWASVLRQDDELVEAHEVASRGAARFPESVGGKLCFNLVAQIEAKSVQITTERVWNKPWPHIDVQYRNITKVHFRAVRYDWNKLIERSRVQSQQLKRDERKALLNEKAALEWSADLPATDDYRQRTEEITPPEGLEPGFYFIISSHNPQFTDNENQVQFTDIWVSDLALITRIDYGNPELGGVVLNAITGDPIAGATVKSWRRENAGLVQGPETKTNENGLFSLKGTHQRSHLLYVEHDGHALSADHEQYIYQQNTRQRPYTRTMFFTDRSLYRPGQTIRFKGLCIDVDLEKDNYAVLPNQQLTVVFSDANGKEIARQQHRSNNYGSFNGSFTAPRDQLMGRMSIRVDGVPQGATAFNVEEYKRPKFEVELEAPEEQARLNDDVTLTGKATAYTGASIGNAQIRYRVVRKVQYPIWWYWRFWWRTPRQDSQEIAHGTAVTNNSGGFEITFTAKPDPTVPKEDEPTFQFTVHADVTDSTGETRSGQRTVNVGYNALNATITTDDWQTDDEPIKLSIRTTTLDGEGESAEGTVKIYHLKQPDKVERGDLSGHRPYPIHRRGGRIIAPEPDPTNPNSWPLGDVAAEEEFRTDGAGNATVSVELKAGPYKAMLETQDKFGEKVTAELPLQVVDPDADQLAIKIPNIVAAPKWSLEPGEELSALWGTGYDKGRAFIEIEHRGKMIRSFWTPAGKTQVRITQAVDEAMRGGFTLHVTFVRENRAYLTSRHVSVPWSNKELTLKWEHFTSKLKPAQQESWSLVITGPDAEKAAAEMVATLYDESLDAYLKHNWPQGFGVFRSDHSRLQRQFQNVLENFQHIHGNWTVPSKTVTLTYRRFPDFIVQNVWGYQYLRRKGLAGGPAQGRANMLFEQQAPQSAARLQDSDRADGVAKNAAEAAADKPPAAPPGPDLSQVTARKNLNETAFFFPHLLADDAGRVKLEFTMPEALTRWKFFGFAHDGQLRSGFLEDSVVTSKDLMIEPNPPRFVREGDILEFTVKVTNQSPSRQTGTVRLTLADARTNSSVDETLGNTELDQEFDVPAGESRSFSWRLQIPDGTGFLVYKAVGSTGRLSDGEEGYLPVLSRRVLVRESMPLPIRGPQTKQFEFSRLLNSGASDTLINQSLTVQVVSNPAWYAVMALPYLMEYPYDCTEQVFNRLYANSLARHIAKSDPKIRRIFDQWKATPALESPLEKNEDLKAVMLEETPWVRQAEQESQARRNIGILFDDNRLNTETARLLAKLAEQQRPDGAWPWFPGGPANDYITLYITTGFGRMRHLGIDVDVSSGVKALTRLDRWIHEIHQRIVEHKTKDKNNLSSLIALYLYGRSFYLNDQPIADEHEEAVKYFRDQARQHWLDLPIRQSQAHLAVALKRFGDNETPQAIMRSIKERSVSNEELGMFWRDLEISWWWFRAPIETQAMMIEAFDEVMNDAEAVEDCKVWLIKQKQTQDWKTTKATADAVYALMLRGENLLASDALVEVSLGETVIDPQDVEAGTGFYEERFVRKEILPEFGEVTLKKVDKGVAWGSLHWQYLEDVDKITPYEGTPLKLNKRLFTRHFTKAGPELRPVDGGLSVGDELVVRVELRVDRDMEYVHLKDSRGSGTEPVEVLSHYRYQDGLVYYQSTRDTASHFFIDYLPKGVYVFEYSTRVVHKGRYTTGTAEIQCMYAPEFNSHSESHTLVVE